MRSAIKNIGLLFTGQRVLKDVDLIIEDGQVVDIGSSELDGYDAAGNLVIPGFVDCHTHLVFAGDRAYELKLRLEGESYLSIAQKGGGIMKTVLKTRKASEEELFKTAQKRLKKAIRAGTTTIEIKSGYGLSLEDEIKILKVIKRLRDESPIDIVATFLGGHVVPEGVDRKRYLRIVTDEMLPRVREEDLADFCDVFCDEGAFTVSETETILTRAQELGFMLKVHAEELSHTGISSLAAEMGAVSCDHLNHITEDDLIRMEKNGTVAVLLPGTSFFLDSGKPPVTEIIKSGVDIAIATDYNPGTCPILSMPIILALGCLYYRMPITEVVRGVTRGGALGIGREDIGMLEKGSQADLIVFQVPDLINLVYNLDDDNIVAIFKKGVIIYHR